MQRLLQKDPRWTMKKIGKTNLTIGRMGCTITCVSMVSDWFKCFKRPDELANLLSFTADGLLIWNSIEKELCFKLLKRFYGWDLASIDDGIKDDNKVSLLEVDNSHWVLATKRIFNSKHYMTVDPLGGLPATLKYKRVTGGAILIKK